ncbi:MAG: arsenite methyltransferase [Bacillota bacterium]
MEKESIKKSVREKYARVSTQSGSCCTPQTSCCGDTSPTLENFIGYSAEELSQIPQEAILGLGCGNPLALTSIKEGETVLDLGSGAGIDCFLAAARVGPTGKVIGVDMTAEMLEKARANVQKGNYTNVEFRLGEIENLPVADNCVDLVISNCVINLSTDKKRVFAESFRVLKGGGRLMVSDLVLQRELPPAIRRSVEAYAGCIAGAVLKEEYLDAVRAAGFTDIEIKKEQVFPVEHLKEDPFIGSLMRESEITPAELESLEDTVLSISLFAKKPEKV